MFETEAQLDGLQALIDASFANAGAHLLSISRPDRRLSARQVATLLQGTRHVAFATVTSKGEPRVAPLDGLFLWGRFHVGTDGRSLRARHLRRNPNVSLTHFQGDDFSIVVHGRATIIEKGDADADAIDAVWREIYKMSAFDLAENVIFARVEPTHMFTFAQDPSKFPE
ncbi:MAG TPA: pyridoxamine 5'-phosphate oxidase family protein [Dehalococcoidia bacterium]|nr:pyridoxamine 5'-phosphate oxidase family protein [Dehalococcoidia bacterium]